LHEVGVVLLAVCPVILGCQHLCECGLGKQAD
jgi:hypothetical protein